MRICIVMFVLMFSSSVMAENLDYVPGEVVITFNDGYKQILNLSNNGIDCVYPEIGAYLNNNNIINIQTRCNKNKYRYLLQFDENIDVNTIVNELINMPQVIFFSLSFNWIYFSLNAISLTQ